jgi:Protein of unknown function (DUF2848)
LSHNSLAFECIARGQSTQKAVDMTYCVIAGWTGRDKAAVEKHIRELEELGVARPAQTPVYYRVAARRLSQEPRLECSGDQSSGEVEFALIKHEGTLWVGVGSDHTDRHVETYNVTVSKQMCDKPLARMLWLYDDVAAHWDKLMMRSYIIENGARVLYQEGSVLTMLDPQDLLRGYGSFDALPEGFVMFCGTFAAKGGIRPSTRFEFEMEDPVLNRRISHAYNIEILPVLG